MNDELARSGTRMRRLERMTRTAAMLSVVATLELALSLALQAARFMASSWPHFVWAKPYLVHPRSHGLSHVFKMASIGTILLGVFLLLVADLLFRIWFPKPARKPRR